MSLTVGSKDFTENILVGEMLVQALENEGAEVKSQTNLGGTSVARDALLNDEIDVYPEYTGTGWTVHLKQEDPSQDPEELFKVTSEKDMKENDIKWVGRSPFNDTYGFAANGDLAEKEGGFDFDSMAAYLKANPDTKVCMETEFPDRPDGLVLFEKATGYKIPQSQIQILDTGLIYTETSDGNCDFGEVFTTDGRIQALNLELVEDPGVMILYNLSFTWQNAVYKKHAKIYDELADDDLRGPRRGEDGRAQRPGRRRRPAGPAGRRAVPRGDRDALRSLLSSSTAPPGHRPGGVAASGAGSSRSCSSPSAPSKVSVSDEEYAAEGPGSAAVRPASRRRATPRPPGRRTRPAPRPRTSAPPATPWGASGRRRSSTVEACAQQPPGVASDSTTPQPSSSCHSRTSPAVRRWVGGGE